MRETIDILDIPVDKVTMEDAARKISEFVNSNELHTVFTPNPEIIMIAQEDNVLKGILQQADLVVPDGIGVVIASRMLKGEPLPERVPGFDMVQNTMKDAVYKGYRYYFLGSKPGVAHQAAENMRQKYPGIQIVGVQDGYFKQEDMPDIIEDINQSGANILLVALGAPKQEIWIDQYKEQMKYVRVAIGVGGSLDVMAGEVKRAPEFFQKVGLEWFYRLVSQPTRAKRMLLLPQFIVKVWCKKYKNC
ncbi:MAG: WecB/TagA/CpsF family glycosyltransferase [Cellulosilyticaceae bacterium]